MVVVVEACGWSVSLGEGGRQVMWSMDYGSISLVVYVDVCSLMVDRCSG